MKFMYMNCSEMNVYDPYICCCCFDATQVVAKRSEQGLKP